MSAIYNLEPQPTGSAIIHTTQGEIAIELFAKQTPLTCRNFLQHCLDGYYDNTLFFRLVPGFILQGGDPTNSGHGGESIYDGGAFSGDLDPWPMDQRHGANAGPHGVGLKDEFHSRLKFNRRGLLAMANEGKPDSNGSQFFFTLAQAEELNGKNTLFGRVVGDTIYNLAKIGEGEVDSATDRPLFPAKITAVEIRVNPFEDMVKRERTAPSEKKVVVERKKKKRKGGKQLLSFDDGQEEEEELRFKKPKFDTRIVMDVEEEEQAVKQTVGEKAKEKRVKAVPPPRLEDDEGTPGPKSKEQKKSVSRHDSTSPDPEPERPKKKTQLEKTNEEIAALKASLKRTAHEPIPEEKPRHKTALESMLSANSLRGGRKRRGHGAANREDEEALSFMTGWGSKLDATDSSSTHKNMIKLDPISTPTSLKDRTPTGAEDEEEFTCSLHLVPNCQSCQAWDKAAGSDGSDDEGFMTHVLSCKADKLGKDLSFRTKAEEELLVIDPRAKAQTVQERKKQERRGGNKSGREWDAAKNAQMARIASLGGRGAK
jgi:peptidyl-prolyl cis-trans isomerase SDCCAG10